MSRSVATLICFGSEQATIRCLLTANEGHASEAAECSTTARAARYPFAAEWMNEDRSSRRYSAEDLGATSANGAVGRETGSAQLGEVRSNRVVGVMRGGCHRFGWCGSVICDQANWPVATLVASQGLGARVQRAASAINYQVASAGRTLVQQAIASTDWPVLPVCRVGSPLPDPEWRIWWQLRP